MIAAGLLFACMAALAKWAAATLPSDVVVFFRAAAGLIALLPWMLRRGLPTLATQHLRWHLSRGLAGLAAMYCFFYALAHLPLGEAMLLNYSTPLFIPFIALWVLGERPPRRVWVGIVVGFMGLILILKPGMALFAPAALIGVAAGMLAAIAMVSIRRLGQTEPATRIVFYFSVIATIGAAVPLLWRWRMPATDLWLGLIAMGVLATAAQLLLTRAYRAAPAAQIGPFIYLAVVFAGAIGWAVWGEVPDIASVAGTALVVLAGITMWRTPAAAVEAAAVDPKYAN